MRGKSDKKIRERALFILSQSSSPRAQALLGEIARGNANPDLQREAVRYLGMSGNAKSRQLLSEMYASADVQQRQEGDPPRLHALRRQDPRRQRRAQREGSRLCAAKRSARSASWAAAPSWPRCTAPRPNRGVREDIIQALFLSGDSAKIGELARDEKDPTCAWKRSRSSA